jgi:energy-coupling factor transporter ATP-binding protein EcfA2
MREEEHTPFKPDPSSRSNVEAGRDVSARDIIGRDKIEATGNVTIIVGQQSSGPSPEDEAPTPGISPFKGLQYFDVADVELFFGRESLTAKLVGRLRSHKFLAIIGASGSGKSSIARAGLIPALIYGEPLADGSPPPTGFSKPDTYILTPTSHPLVELAVSLTRVSESVTATSSLIDDLRQDARSLDLYARKLISQHSGARLLLVVDQFEELFTLCHDKSEQKQFVDNLMTAVAPETDGPVTLVLTLRADFYAFCAPYETLRDVVARQQEYIGQMTVDELRRAIVEPARHGNWELESGLVDVLLKDIGDEPGALPLLSHALLETWNHRHGHRLTLRGYIASGGVRGAIAKTADRVYADLTSEQQWIARNIFVHLTEIGPDSQDTRRRATLKELAQDDAQAAIAKSVLKKLADNRLVAIDEQFVEVAHEALIREWPKLRNWIDESRQNIYQHRKLADDAQSWLRLERDSGALYRGIRLIQMAQWANENNDKISPLEKEFITKALETVEDEEREKHAQLKRTSDLRERFLRSRTTLVVPIVLAVLIVTVIGTYLILTTSTQDNRSSFAIVFTILTLALLAIGYWIITTVVAGFLRTLDGRDNSK